MEQTQTTKNPGFNCITKKKLTEEVESNTNDTTNGHEN